VIRGILPALLVCTVMLAPACTRSSDGAATAQSGQSSTPATSSTTTASAAPPVAPADDVPGVVPTPGASPTDEDCAPAAPPAVPVDVRIDDPAAPTVVVGAPQEWTTTPSPDGATLTGPENMSATVTITATPLDAAAAFRGYADDLTAKTEMSTLSLLPAETCGFSGQKLMGMLGGTTPENVVYQARIVHVPGYLIAVYVEAPTDTAGFDDAAAVLTQGLRIGLP
jgi:hypothetical protein